MQADASRRGAVVFGLTLVLGGCASVGPAAASKGAASKPVWMVVQAVEGSAAQLDAFESLLVEAGVEDLHQLPQRRRPLDQGSATRLLAMLLERPVPLRCFPQRMGACFLLREVMERGGEVDRGELNRRVERFRHVVVLRPDGYLAWVLNGRTQQRAGPGQVEFKDGVFKANGFVLGQFYSGLWGALRPVDAQMRPLPGTPPMGEVYDDGDVFGRVMDGAEEAFFALAMAVGKFLSRPVDGIAALKDLPAGVAALIVSSPGYLERFTLMTAGEQIREVSRLATTLLTAFAGGGAVSAGLTRSLGGMEVAGLSLSAQGTLTLGRVVIPAGGAATVLTAGVGLPIVLPSAAVPEPDWPAANTGPKLLAPPSTIKHHIFNKFRGFSPASQKYRDFFKKHGIDVDKYTVEIPEKMHTEFIHGRENNWTTRWKQWIDVNPNATTTEVYQFGGTLMDEYGLSGLPLVPYK